MWGSPAVVWAICLACVQPAVFPWLLPFRSNRDRPRPALDVSTDRVECFSDYMTLWIPRSHVEGLRQWLGRVLHVPGTRRAPNHLDSSLAKCGYFLHPAPDGDFIFRAQYSACFVRKEKANYRLEIRLFQKGVKRLEQSDRYVMKCPVITSKLGQESVYCGPTSIQVSRPLPLGSDSGQTPWLLSLRGELVASLEDASLMGLYVDINATTITVQSPRQDLQRWEVLNTSAELLPLWLVSGHYAYSLEAACPPVSSQPESKVLVHIPKQRLGLVKRGTRIEETLNLKFLRVHQSNTFTVNESRDFVLVSIPAAELLQVQQCLEAQGAPGTQAFYRVDLNLEFAETATPVLWIVESFFQCEGSGTELPASTVTLRTTPSPASPGSETPPAGVQSAASSQFQGAGPAAGEGLSWGLALWSSNRLAKAKGLGPFPQTAKPVGRHWTSATSLFSSAMQDQHGPQPPTGEAELPGCPPPSTTLSSESIGAVQHSPGPARSVFPAPTALTLHLSSEVSSPPQPHWRAEQSLVFPVSGPSVTRTEGLGTIRPEQDSTQPPGSPLLLSGLSGRDAAATEPSQEEPGQAGEVSQLLTRPPLPSHSPGEPREESSIIEAEGPPQSGPGLPWEGARGHLDLLSSEPSRDMEGPGLTIPLRMNATFSTARGTQPSPGARPGATGPEPTGRHRVGPAASLAVLAAEQGPAESSHPAALLENPLAATSEKPSALPVGGSGRVRELVSAPAWPVGQGGWGAAHTSSLPPSQTLSPGAPTETSSPSLAELGDPFPAGLGA
ncbi:uncharacterized protein C1orf127 homolog isoform X2 [Cynocephalus volans]|uniref:uncharacterized protein C1orf127 homolog isoform X2 n=1 Tax=Cynocephalus volans TaxID=110931 RepID=UPI002FC90FE3